MKSESFSGSVASAYGETLPKPVAFSGTYEAFETFDEVKGANELPSNDEIVTMVNNKRKANARAKATQAALDAAGIQRPDPNSPEVLRKTAIATLVKLYGMDEGVAASIIDGAQVAK
jgi:hypothetical protein